MLSEQTQKDVRMKEVIVLPLTRQKEGTTGHTEWMGRRCVRVASMQTNLMRRGICVPFSSFQSDHGCDSSRNSRYAVHGSGTYFPLLSDNRKERPLLSRAKRTPSSGRRFETAVVLIPRRRGRGFIPLGVCIRVAVEDKRGSYRTERTDTQCLVTSRRICLFKHTEDTRDDASIEETGVTGLEARDP